MQDANSEAFLDIIKELQQESSDIERICKLMTSHPDVLEESDEHDNTLAHWAASKAKSEILLLILRRNPPLAITPNKAKHLPAHFAAKNGLNIAIEWMTQHYPDLITHQCFNGNTPVHEAAIGGDIKTLHH